MCVSCFYDLSCCFVLEMALHLSFWFINSTHWNDATIKTKLIGVRLSWSSKIFGVKKKGRESEVGGDAYRWHCRHVRQNIPSWCMMGELLTRVTIVINYLVFLVLVWQYTKQ